MLPNKFGVNWPFGSGEEAKKIFKMTAMAAILDFLIGTILAIFLSTFHPDASYQVSSQLALGCRKSRLLKQLFTPHDARRMTHDGRQTLTDHNSSPCALHAQVS